MHALQGFARGFRIVGKVIGKVISNLYSDNIVLLATSPEELPELA